MKIIAVTACPTGIAHTYMAAEALNQAAQQLNLSIHIETQGAMGIEDKLSMKDIINASLILIVSDIPIEQAERFESAKNIYHISIETVLIDALAVLNKYIAKAS